jgi:glycosyltransferase involved in cell wall biosynthesis
MQLWYDMSNHKETIIHAVFVLPSLAFGGGIETHTVKILRTINRSRFKCSLITLFEHPERPDLYGEVPSDVRVVRLASKGIGHLSTWKMMYGALKREEPDVVISSMFSPNAIVRSLKPFFDYKVITREHNTYDEKRWYHRVIDHALSFLSDAIVAVSSDVADFAARQARIPRHKFTVINNGVELDVIDAYIATSGPDISRVRSELGLSGDEKFILNVARLKPTKDHTLLLDAFKIFLERHPNYHLVIAGDGSERPAVEKRIKTLGLSKRAHLLGYRSDIYAWFAAADMFVLSSKREGFPNVALEAAAFGLPIVSTDVAGIHDVVEEGENGCIVNHNPKGLAEGLQRVASLTPAEHKVVRLTDRAITTRFNIPSVTRTYESLIEKLGT